MVAQTSSSESPRTVAIAAIVEKAGVATRPVSIFRRVSGEIPAARATSSMERSVRARRSRAPRFCPRSISAGVSGSLTIVPMIVDSAGIVLPVLLLVSERISA